LKTEAESIPSEVIHLQYFWCSQFSQWRNPQSLHC